MCYIVCTFILWSKKISINVEMVITFVDSTLSLLYIMYSLFVFIVLEIWSVDRQKCSSSYGLPHSMMSKKDLTVHHFQVHQYVRFRPRRFNCCEDEKTVFILLCEVVPVIFRKSNCLLIDSLLHGVEGNKRLSLVRVLKVLSSHLNWGARLDSFDPL